MITTEQYLTQLTEDRKNIASNLRSKGIDTTGQETFTELADKVKEIPFVVFDGWKVKGVDISHLDLPKEALNEILSRLADVKSESEDYDITFGGDNLAKLTVKEMNVARDKGWKIY